MYIAVLGCSDRKCSDQNGKLCRSRCARGIGDVTVHTRRSLSSGRAGVSTNFQEIKTTKNTGTLQHTATQSQSRSRHGSVVSCNTMQHTATRCNTMSKEIIKFQCCELQHTTTHCNTLQHTATQSQQRSRHSSVATCNNLQHIATHCNTLQHKGNEITT